MFAHLPSARHLARHGRHLLWLIASLGLLATLLPALAQPALSLQTLPDGRVQLRWPKSSAGFVLESAFTLAQPLVFQPVTQTPADAGTEFTLAVAAADTTQFYRLRQTSLGFPVTILATSPTPGEGGVAVTRETVIRFDGALAGDTALGANSLFAEAAGRRLLTRTELATDRRSVSLFYQEPLPGGARVQVTFDGTGLRDTAGLELDADGDTVPGGLITLRFDTMNNLAVGETAVTGKVFASERNADGTDRPLAGVTVTVDGQEETLRAVTGADGSFVLQPAPAGRFFVHVDGRTAQGSQWPTGAYYPFVGKAWEAVPGKTNNLAGGNGLIYLPFIQSDALKPVSATTATPVTFAPSVLATNPALAGVEITVPANSMFADNGTRGGRVGIAPVPPDRLPEPLPAGLNFPLVITIQTDGPSNFDRPVPVRFPNLPDPATGELLPPGAKTALWSFNHDTGRWEIQGGMTISADGRFAVSDPGVGVLQPGWHGSAPGSGGNGPGGGGGSGGGDGDCDGPDCDDEPTFADPLGECGRKGVKAFKGTVELATDLLEIGETFKPFNPKKCLGGFLEGAVSALADCALEQFDGDECANDFQDEGVASTLGCVPYAGGLLKAAWDLGNLEKDYREAYESCAGGGGGNFEAAPLAGRHGIARAATGSFPGGFYTALKAAATELGRQKSFAQVSSNLFGTLFGGDRWSGIDSPAAAAAWFTFFGAIEQAVAPTGDGGNAVTPAERNALLVGVLPNGATAAEAAALVDRIAALAAGTQFSDAAFRAALGPATGGFLTELAARTGDGWTYALEGLQRALLASTQAQQAMLSYAHQTGAARVGGSGGGGSGGGGSGGGAVGGASGGVVQPPRAERAWLLVNLETGFEQRGRLNSAGRFDPVILAPESFYLVLYSEPERSRVGAAYFMSAAAGQPTTIPTAMMFEDDFPDSDGDQLSNLAERVMGTSPALGDSDGDGVLDGAEVANRSNPLDNSPMATGVVASVDTPGSALDVDVTGDFAVVADGTAGFSVVDVSNPFAPVLVSQVDLAANPKAVAVAGNRALLAAGSRYYVADLSAPAAPVIVADVALTAANQVAVAGRTGFVTSGAKVRAVDLFNGATLGEATLSSPIGDLAVTRDLLLALTSTELRVLRIRQLLPEDPVELLPLGQLAVAGSSSPLEAGRRLFAAGSRAYAGYFQGYSILNLANPAAPELLAKEPATQAAIHDLATDGSGRLVAITSFGGTVSLAVGLYDVRGDDDVTRFQTSWNTPGDARALVLHRGLAFVADTGGGLQTVNFAAADTGTNPPAITLEALLPAPGTAESGGNLRLLANTTDDVMVREVEFYLDGVRVAVDGANPFEWHGVAPWFSTSKTNFTVRARATDTGGNSRWSEELVIALQDTTPHRIIALEPTAGFASATTAVNRVRVLLDGPALPASVTPDRLTLAHAGPNRVRGDADDTAVPGVLQLESGDSALRLAFSTPLPTGRYRATLAAGLKDFSGLASAADVTWDFEVLPPRPRAVAPMAGTISQADQLTEVRAQFDVPMDAATLNTTNLLVLSAGPDGTPGNADDVPVPAAGVTYEAANRIATWQAVTPLGLGRYTVRLRPAITGAIGNALTNDFTWGFEVRGPVSWLSDASGLWTTVTNWSGGRVPDRDFVVIDRPNADPLVTVTSQSRSLGWLRSTEAMSFSSSSFRLGDDSFIRGAVILDRSELTATNGLELSGTVTLRRRSDLNGVVAVSGALTLDGTGAKELRQAVTLSGPVTIAEGPLSVVNGVLTLAAGATLDFAPTNAPTADRDQINNGGGSSGALHNFGVIRHRGGERALLFWGLDVMNHSLIEATNGWLGFLSGRFDQNAGALLRAAAPAWFSGVVGEWAGEFRLTGGLFLTNSGVNLRGSLATGDAGLSQHGGTFNVHSPLTLAQLSLRNGVLGIYAATDITGPARLPGAPEFTGTDRLRFFGDVSLGQVDIRGSLRVENHGRLVLTNSMRASLQDQVVFVNAPAGEVNLTGNLALLGSSTAAPRIINQGRLRSTAPVSDDDDHTRLWGNVENSGRMEVEQGRLQLEADSGHDGEVTVAAGATLELDSRIGAGGSSTHRFRSASRVHGAGTVEFSTTTVVIEGLWEVANTWLRSGRLVIPGDRQMPQLRLAAGELEPHGLLDLTGVLDSTGGAVRSPGVVRLSGQFAGPTNRFPSLAAGGRFELASSVEMTSMGSMFSEAGGTWRLLPGAELRVESAGFTGAGAFLNEGRLVTGTTNAALSFDVPLTNSGVIAVQGGTMFFQRLLTQAAGQMRLEGGTLRIGTQSAGPARGILLHGGEFLGAGLVDGLSNWPFTNSAVLRPGLPIGQLTMDLLRYTQTTNGVLEIELGGRTPGTEHDQLVLTGDLRQLAGTLDVKLVNGFVPDIGDRFHIVNADWQRGIIGPNNLDDGEFTTVNFPALPAGRRWQIVYNRISAPAHPGVELRVIAGP